MNFRLSGFVAEKLAGKGKRSRFLNFARVVALISVMLGTMALIISLSVLEGFDRTLKENAVKFTSHISIRSFTREHLENYEESLEMIRSHPQVESAAPLLSREGLVRSSSYIEGIVLRGILPEYDITGLSDKMIQGKFSFSSDSAKELIIGKRLAQKLEVKKGDEIVVYMINPKSGSMPETSAGKFTVKGIYETGMAQYDDIFVYLPFYRAQEFFRMPGNSVSMYEVMLKDINKAKGFSLEIEKQLGYPHYALTVFDLHRSIFSWIELQKEPIPIVLALISIVAVLNIITTLLITVVEKTNSIGILRALGMPRNSILSVFVFQGVSIGAAGTLIGSALAFIATILQQNFEIVQLKGEIYFLDVLPMEIVGWHYAIVIAISIILAFLSTLIPSLVATRITPIRAIRFK